MTKEEIINTLSNLGIGAEDELELTGILGLDLEPTGNKILRLGNSIIGLLTCENGNYKVELEDYANPFKESSSFEQIKELASLTTFENIEVLNKLRKQADEYLTNITTLIECLRK